jgi:antitoxin (DNA-binding transcriptional repressor) of toxin-antitoxin stability system
MPSTTLADAQAHLASWIAKLKPGEVLVIIENGRPIARLIKEPIQHADSSKQLPDDVSDDDSHRKS